MFGKLVRSLVATVAPDLPRAVGPRRRNGAGLDDILSVPSLPLRALFEDRYNSEVVDYAAASRESNAAFAAAFADDPLTIGLALINRAPLMNALARENTPGQRRLDGVFKAATEAARRAIVVEHDTAWPIADRDLSLTLRALGVLVAQGAHELYNGYGQWLEPVVRAASTRSDPAVRDGLIAMFRECGEGVAYSRDRVIALVETLLPLTGLARNDVALLVQKDRAGSSSDAVRARIRVDAGEVLWPAMEAVLDNQPGAGDFHVSEANRHPAIKAVFDQTPEARGDSFCKLLDIVTDPSRYGTRNWASLERQGGQYRAGVQAKEHVLGLGDILGGLAARKMVLADPDGDAARFMALLPHYIRLDNKRVLGFLLDVARAHPFGRTTAALRALMADQKLRQSYDKWLVDIEDMLRDLQSAIPASMPAGVAAASTGFGRKGAVSLTPTAPLLPGFAPITLPEFRIDTYLSVDTIAQHFDAILDARLYDAPHSRFLTGLAAFADRVDALQAKTNLEHEVETDELVHEIDKLVKLSSLHGSPGPRGIDGFNLHPLVYFPEAVKLACNLRDRFEAFAPFVTSQPEVARRIGKLANAIAGKSAPSAKWLAEGCAVVADLREEDRIATLRMVVDTPAPSFGFSGGEQYLRAILYLSADLDHATVGPMLTDYALRRCYVTVPGIGIRSEKLGNACLWTLAAMPDGAGVRYLARILARTKYPKIRAKIDEKLNEAGRRDWPQPRRA